MPSLYQILELPDFAPLPEIKSAFRRLSKQWHPDKNPGDPAAAARFREILEAYKTLSDESSREEYDHYLRSGVSPEDMEYYGDEPYAEQKQTRRNGCAISILVVLALLLFKFVVMKLSEPTYTFDKKNITQYINVLRDSLEVSRSADSLMVRLRNGDSCAFSIWTRQTESQFGALDMDWRTLFGAEDNFLHVTAADTSRNGAPCNWLFRKNASAGLVEVLAHQGGVKLDDFTIRLNFGVDVDTFKSCRQCDVAGLPYTEVEGVYLQYQQGGFIPSILAKTDVSKYIRANLSELSGRKTELAIGWADDGTRKAYLRQLLTWHFLHGDLSSTQQLFEAHFRYPDRQEMWTCVQEYIRRYEKLLAANMDFRNIGEPPGPKTSR